MEQLTVDFGHAIEANVNILIKTGYSLKIQWPWHYSN
jgi:hypothetical protein